MKLGEFIKQFSHNNLIRLVYKNKGGHECVLDDWNAVSMDHEILSGKGKNRHYIDNEVLGLAGIYFPPAQGHHYPDAINIVIEQLENQPFIEETVSEVVYESES
jgi:coproporphyrinogen III oxidase